MTCPACDSNDCGFKTAAQLLPGDVVIDYRGGTKTVRRTFTTRGKRCIQFTDGTSRVVGGSTRYEVAS